MSLTMYTVYIFPVILSNKYVVYLQKVLKSSIFMPSRFYVLLRDALYMPRL